MLKSLISKNKPSLLSFSKYNSETMNTSFNLVLLSIHFSYSDLEVFILKLIQDIVLSC